MNQRAVSLRDASPAFLLTGLLPIVSVEKRRKFTFGVPEMTWTSLRGTTRTGKIAFHAGLFLFALLILFSRRPDALLTPQFYAEDGAYWYVDAYQSGLRCLLMPNGGYLNTLSRIIGLLALLVPFAWAPVVMVFSALAFHILPVNLFLSSRFDRIPFETRLLGSLIYLGVPNSFEIHANTTNIQWHLAIACLLVLFAPAENAPAWRIVDLTLFALSVLAGPLGMFLIPIAAVLWWKRRDHKSLTALAVLIPGAILQSLFILFSGSRPYSPNGATVDRFVGILGGQVFLSSLLGLRTFIQLYFAHVSFLFVVQAVAMLIGLTICIYAAVRAPFELKLFLLYAAIAITFALSRPYAILRGNYEQWQLMQTPGITNRYWFFPMLAFLACLIWMVTGARKKSARYAALLLLALLPIGIYRDWVYRPFPDKDFHQFVAEFERAAPGTEISIPINPVSWEMHFIKR
jgi:hypothetical protein